MRVLRVFAERQVSKVAEEKTKQEQVSNANEYDETSVLVGYVRKSNAGGAVKVSINADAFTQCRTYMTSDGQTYVPLIISINALTKVMNGERSVTTISQFIE